MHILCTICSDLVEQTQKIYVTRCGHVFHYYCLTLWIIRSKSCPQCRNEVTDKSMFRLYPTTSDENIGEDITAVQSRLDDAQLEVMQQVILVTMKDNKIAAITDELKRNKEILRVIQLSLVRKESAMLALKQQLEYVTIENRETQKLREENESLKKNMQTLNGLQKVLNATSDEVEQMLEGYSDVRTVATFATALKRALCESERKNNKSKDRLQSLKLKLCIKKSIVSDLNVKLMRAEDKLWAAQRKYKHLKGKRKASEGPDRLLTALTEASFEATGNQMRPSDEVFHKKQPVEMDFDEEHYINMSQLNVSYDGLGGHSKLDTFPKSCSRPQLKSCVPKLKAKHKLRIPTPAVSQDVVKYWLEKIRNLPNSAIPSIEAQKPGLPYSHT